MLNSKTLIVSGTPIWVIFQNSVTYQLDTVIDRLYLVSSEKISLILWDHREIVEIMTGALL